MFPRQFDFDKPRQKDYSTPLPSLTIKSSNGEIAKATIYLLADKTFQSVVYVNNCEAIGVSPESPELATEDALNQLGNVSADEDPVWTVRYKPDNLKPAE